MNALIPIVAALISLVAGLIIGLKLAERSAQARRQDLQDRLSEAQADLAKQEARLLQLERENSGLQATLDERQKLLEAEQTLAAQMREAFAALSRDALSQNSEEFLKLAQQRFESLAQAAEGTLAAREEAVRGVVDPLTALLKQYDQALRDLELKRQSAYTSLEERLRALAEAESGLQQETNRLVTALRRPEVRGRWGEMTLRNAVEAAGMSDYCDFAEQQQVTGETGTLRPDMVIRLPGERLIVVDNKVPLDAYLSAIECTDLPQREQFLRQHATQCRRHMESLAKKAYWDQFDTSPNCVVMFIPMESLYAAALEADRELLRWGLENRVVLATPATFVALLHTVAYGWQQHKFAQSALEVRDLAVQFYDRLRVFATQFQKVGRQLGSSLEAYNQAVGSLESRLLVTARKLKELGTTGKEDLPELEPLDTMPRAVGAELLGLPGSEDETTEEERETAE